MPPQIRVLMPQQLYQITPVQIIALSPSVIQWLSPAQWQVLRPEAETDLASVNVPAGQWLVPFPLWLAKRDALKSRTDIAVWLSPNDDLADADRFDLVG